MHPLECNLKKVFGFLFLILLSSSCYSLDEHLSKDQLQIKAYSSAYAKELFSLDDKYLVLMYRGDHEAYDFYLKNIERVYERYEKLLPKKEGLDLITKNEVIAFEKHKKMRFLFAKKSLSMKRDVFDKQFILGVQKLKKLASYMGLIRQFDAQKTFGQKAINSLKISVFQDVKKHSIFVDNNYHLNLSNIDSMVSRKDFVFFDYQSFKINVVNNKYYAVGKAKEETGVVTKTVQRTHEDRVKNAEKDNINNGFYQKRDGSSEFRENSVFEEEGSFLRNYIDVNRYEANVFSRDVFIPTVIAFDNFSGLNVKCLNDGIRDYIYDNSSIRDYCN